MNNLTIAFAAPTAKDALRSDVFDRAARGHMQLDLDLQRADREVVGLSIEQYCSEAPTDRYSIW